MSCWFGDLFDDLEITFTNHGSTWAVQDILSSQTMTSFSPYEERMVLHCKQVKPSPGEEAIIKAHLQVPDEDGLPAEELAEQASTQVNRIAETEIEFLMYLTKHDCSSTPRLLDVVKLQQSGDMCLPGGYMLFILIKKLPGKMILDYWDYDRETRDRIRAAFKTSWIEINNACIYHCDQGRRNLLWHEEAEKCYILDFEDANFIEKPYKWLGSEFLYWELIDDDRGQDVL